jgi:hypothetical protein
MSDWLVLARRVFRYVWKKFTDVHNALCERSASEWEGSMFVFQQAIIKAR